MATTKIWDVSAHVSKLLAYVANKNKTTMELEVKSDNETENLAAEILGLPPEHFLHEEKKFVTGINCTPENANEVMLTLLEGTSPSDTKRWQKCALMQHKSRLRSSGRPSGFSVFSPIFPKSRKRESTTLYCSPSGHYLTIS